MSRKVSTLNKNNLLKTRVVLLRGISRHLRWQSGEGARTVCFFTFTSWMMPSGFATANHLRPANLILYISGVKLKYTVDQDFRTLLWIDTDNYWKTKILHKIYE